jgi:hypothetical protein
VVAASVAVITSGAVAVGAQLTNDANTDSAAATTTPPTSSPNRLITPPGTRLVGRNGIGIAVPAEWGTNQASCHTAYRDTVIVGSNPGVDCGMFVGASVSSAILDTFDAFHAHPGDSHASIQVNGEMVTRISGSYTWGPSPYHLMYTTTLLSETRNVSIEVRSPNRSVVARVIDSAFAFPSRFSVIPDEPTGPSLRRHGLGLHRVLALRPKLYPETILGSDPPQGSIVPRGSTVTVTTTEPNCNRVSSDVVTPADRLPLYGRADPYEITVTVGDVVRLRPIPGCTDSPAFHYSAGSSLIGKATPSSFIAAHPGTFTVAVSTTVCPVGVDCSGLRAQVLFRVLP